METTETKLARQSMEPTMKNDLESSTISHLNVDSLNKMTLELCVEHYVLMCL